MPICWQHVKKRITHIARNTECQELFWIHNRPSHLFWAAGRIDEGRAKEKGWFWRVEKQPPCIFLALHNCVKGYGLYQAVWGNSDFIEIKFELEKFGRGGIGGGVGGGIL